MMIYLAKLCIFFFLLITTLLHVHGFDQNNNSSNTQNSTIDPYAFLYIIPNPDGSITRLKEYFPTVPPNSSTLAISKDTPLNPKKNTWVRVYLPNIPENARPGKLPAVVFVHGGGFILLSAASPNYNNLCLYTANRLGALVVSVEYRLSPEHRLPASYEDVLEALHWLKEGKDEWVKEYGDVSKCFLMGTSAGANTAYNIGLRVSALAHHLKPLTIKGLILVQPFFGGVERTSSELKLVDDTVIPLVVTDLMWELSLPIGANRNHMYCNPLIGGGSSKLKKIRDFGWKVVVVGCDGDPLYDRQVDFVKLLEKRGVDVMSSFCQGGYHGIYNKEPAKIEELLKFVRNVVSPCLAS